MNRPARVYETRLGGVRVRVVLTGIGQRAATAAAAAVFQDRPDVCIASGLAGGLNDTLRVAEIIAAGRVRDRDGRGVDSDPRLLALAVSGGATVVKMYSSPIVLVSTEEKRRLSAIADAADMESTAILRESHLRGIPCIAIRAISDPATVDLPLDFNQALSADGQFSAFRTFTALARRPQALPGLLRLGLDGRRATAALAAFLDGYVQALAAGSFVSAS